MTLTDAKTVPTIGISPLFGARDYDWIATADTVSAAFRDIGFLCVTGAEVAPDLVNDLRAAMVALFALADADKKDQAVKCDNYRGFIPFGFFTPDDGTGTVDNYEGYKLHAETAPDNPVCTTCTLYGPNLWPAEVPDLKPLVPWPTGPKWAG